MNDERAEKRRRITRGLHPIDEQRYAQDANAMHEVDESDVDKDGVVRVNTGSLSMPEDLATEGEYKKTRGANMVFVVILAVMLAFIAVVAWLVANSQG
jgi:hypothetical protein